MDQKSMVHLHQGILCSREKEGAPTLWDSMNGTGEHYAKWNKQKSKQNITRDIEIKNKLTVTKGEVGGDNGGTGEKGFQELLSRTHGQNQGGWKQGREVGMTGVGRSGGGG